MTEYGRIPEHVEVRMRGRLTATRRRFLPCAGCNAPPELAVNGCTTFGGMWCNPCFDRMWTARGGRHVPTPDPTRTMAALRGRMLAAVAAARQDSHP